MKYTLFYMISLLLISSYPAYAQNKDTKNEEKEKGLTSSTLNGLKFRSIGPAFTSGRIADFAINSKNHSEYYVAVASGHIWKTENNGTTFNPVFDNYGTYSIGCIKADPQNFNVVWAGTGENNHQRALGYGNGVYKTVDGGKTWKNMGLKESRQIGMIAIDPRNSDIVFVAAEGSAWGPGGERGLYKTNDGGKNWKKVLSISENTGVNNVIIDPENPQIMYATSEQRRRHIYTKIGGGPETGFYKSYDSGETWQKITNGIPTVDMGGIGIDISPANPDIVYLIIEAAEDEGGFFRSEDKGESWSKMSDYSSSGQYYNEIYCDPVDINKVYSVETISKFTEDGGKSWKQLGLTKRHVDDHAMWINPNDPSNYKIGGDGGVYETFDCGKSYRFISNLPVTQFYRVYLDNAVPFYNVYGGTQDNNSFGGPSRNMTKSGVSSEEWFVTLGGDGFWGAVDPDDSNIIYSEYQYGNVYRYDRKTGEAILIKPFPAKGEKSYKWNWNAPLIMSPHNHERIYIAANKLFRSNDKGNTWETISPDLTTQIDRNSWKVMDKYWSIDAVSKDVSTSLFGTIVSLDESLLKEGLLYVGTDDGLIQVSEDGGKNWTKSTNFPGIPEFTYVSDILADKFNDQVVYASFDNIQRDDFKPYLLKSTDRGKSWKSITSNLPLNGTVHTIQQDFVNPDLIFVGTEFGIFFSVNGGEKWIQLKSGIPDIAVRDLAIQKRETDLVLATFGRGFYSLENYEPLRIINDKMLEDNEAFLFPVKDALQFIQMDSKDSQGSTFFFAENPPYGAIFTYYLKDVPKTLKEIRKETEKQLFEKGEKIYQPTREELEKEKNEEHAFLLFTITDSAGNIIRKITQKPEKGVNRITWDLTYETPYPIEYDIKEFDPLKKRDGEIPVLPGKYRVSMSLCTNGDYKAFSKPVDFNVVKLNNSSIKLENQELLYTYLKDLNETIQTYSSTYRSIKELQNKIVYIKQTLVTNTMAGIELNAKITIVDKELKDLFFALEGEQAKASYEELPPHELPVGHRLENLSWGRYGSLSDVTETEKMQFKVVNDDLIYILLKLKTITEKSIPEIERELDQINAPWTPGRTIKND
jgi:photosystem II stability/assembly factor-like uncharacterized protein